MRVLIQEVHFRTQWSAAIVLRAVSAHLDNESVLRPNHLFNKCLNVNEILL